MLALLHRLFQLPLMIAKQGMDLTMRFLADSVNLLTEVLARSVRILIEQRLNPVVVLLEQRADARFPGLAQGWSFRTSALSRT
jgi:hypothetical protein